MWHNDYYCYNVDNNTLFIYKRTLEPIRTFESVSIHVVDVKFANKVSASKILINSLIFLIGT